MSTISNGPRPINSLMSRAGRPAPSWSFTFRGQRFSVQRRTLNLQEFTALGFAPRRFVEGVQVYVMEPAEYQRFAAACNTDSVAGFYPLSRNGEAEAVDNDQLVFLPNHSRIVVLPATAEPITLVHELLHDIFMGGGLELRDRQEFIKNVLFWYRLSVDPKMPRHHPSRSFYEAVAEVCAQRYQIEKINPRYNFGRHTQERDFRIFANECFAYAGEHVLFPQESMIERVPPEIISFFRYVRLFDRSVYQLASGQV